jgi:dolichol-phosphate mannosyltransferase
MLKLISVVVPVYGCRECLNELYKRLDQTLNKITNNYEIIFVCDGDPTNSWVIISELAGKDNRVKGLNLSRNFGQHNALTAGLEYSKGEWVVVMDCDLQDQPEEIENFYYKAMEGYDVVLGKRIRRFDGFFKRTSSWLFYRTLSYLTNSKHDCTIANFGIYKNKVIKAVLMMKDSIRYFPTMINWVGFKSVSMEVLHSERSHNKSGYSFKKLLKLATEIILSFSDKPLRLIIKFGLLISLASFLFAIYYLILYINGKVAVTGWTSLIVSIWFLSGIIIFVLGTVGLYVGKTFEKVKQRPIYLISESLNIDEE